MQQQQTKIIPEGTYKAKALRGCFLESSKKGTFGVAIQFALVGRTEKISWWGYMPVDAPKSTEITMKALAVLGFRDDKEVTDPNGEFDNSYLADKEVEIVIVHEADDKGDTRARVQWVNEIGGGAGARGNLAPQELKQRMSTINFRAELQAAREKLGMNAQEQAAPAIKNHAPQAPRFNSEEKLPF